MRRGCKAVLWFQRLSNHRYWVCNRILVFFDFLFCGKFKVHNPRECGNLTLVQVLLGLERAADGPNHCRENMWGRGSNKEPYGLGWQAKNFNQGLADAFHDRYVNFLECSQSIRERCPRGLDGSWPQPGHVKWMRSWGVAQWYISFHRIAYYIIISIQVSY